MKRIPKSCHGDAAWFQCADADPPLCLHSYLVDSHFGTKLMVPMLILGVLAGGRCGWVMARNTLLQEQKEDERLRQQQSAGQGRSGISKPKQPSRILRESSQTETGTAGRSAACMQKLAVCRTWKQMPDRQ